MRLEARRVIVTGGASGIGKACADRSAAEGAQVIVLDREAGAGAIAVDVTQEASVESAMSQAAVRLGGLDVLVNCAGIPARKPVGEQDGAGWDEVQRVNVRGTFLCSKYALPHLAERGGAIIHMASVVGIVGMRNRAAYSASKGAIVALTRNMALDYASRRIRVNCVCPGFTRTPMTASIFADPGRLAGLTALHPLGRLGEPDDIAAAVVFLASDEASWITGIALAVDGGFTAGHAADV
jgi:NAD(P)-dependent dehydrogenase (short-subunit alcohol dehydrogenase family)